MRERNIHVREQHQSLASHTLPTGDLARSPGVSPDWESNWQPLGLQAGTQSTEPHQPGPIFKIYQKIWQFVGSRHPLKGSVDAKG